MELCYDQIHAAPGRLNLQVSKEMAQDSPFLLLVSSVPTEEKSHKYFPCDSTGKESTCNAGDMGSVPGLGRSPGEGKGYPLQYSGLENPMDCIVYGVTKSWTQLNDF